MDGVCGTYGEQERCVQGFRGIPKGKWPFGRRRYRWEYNNKMDLQEVTSGGMKWIALAEDRNSCWALVNAVMNLRVL